MPLGVNIFRVGVVVKGPTGIGKSHSLVNLVRKLLYDSNGKYLVTFIQDCEKFEDVYDLFDTICLSFGTSLEEIEFQIPALDHYQCFHIFINAIDSFLEKSNKQWVFIFDQINRLFARPEIQRTKRLSYLPFPFYTITAVLKRGRITSIVSASANNEIDYDDKYRGFEEYYHCLVMSEDEVKIASDIDTSNEQQNHLEMVIKVTGGVPLQVENLVTAAAFDVEKYTRDELERIYLSLNKLMKKSSRYQIESIASAAVACVLSSPTQTSFCFDRRHTVFREASDCYDPLYPLVLVAYRNYFRDSFRR